MEIGTEEPAIIVEPAEDPFEQDDDTETAPPLELPAPAEVPA